jgi:4,5-DOPA dioxygenase extradiol
MYPEADVPVFQMSIAYGKPLRYHFELAKELAFLRSKGVLVLASGNIVHNLGAISYDQPEPYDWAIEFDAFVKDSLNSNDQEALLNYEKLGSVAKLAHPTNDHYLPLLYAAGLRSNRDSCRFFNEGFDLGSISMRTIVFG